LKHLPEIMAQGFGSLHWKAIASSRLAPQSTINTAKILFMKA
jgi:hypothetical protein